MKPVSQIPVEQLRGIKYLLTDIDDTVTDGGLLPAASLAAIERLDGAGIGVVLVTGRPAGAIILPGCGLSAGLLLDAHGF